jgi:predicted nucleotidyltransferase
MAYTEIKERNRNKYYYRVISIRKKNKVLKEREYLGANLNKRELNKKELEADKILNALSRLKAIDDIKPKIIAVLKKNNIKRAGIFGSYARGEQRKNSDIDIVIEPVSGMGFKFAGIELELEKSLRKKVDLVSYNGLSPHLKNRILNQEVRII